MKHFLFAATLALLAATPSQARDYTSNPDGTSSYIGNCVLHLDYLGKGIERGLQLTPTIYFEGEAETRTALQALSSEARDLIREAAKTVNPEVSGESLTRIVRSFDDLSIFEVNLNYYQAPSDVIKVVSYGVGNGNGGYLFLEKTGDRAYELVGHNFDGDLELCDDRYRFDQ